MTRLAALGGIAGPILFGTTIVVVGYLRLNYNHATQFISELGETGSDFSSLMNYLGFMTSATLIMLFGAALRSTFPPMVMTNLASGLVVIYASGMFLAGVFSCDSSCLPVDPTREQLLHDFVSFIAFFALISSSLLWGVYFRNNPKWRGFGIYSLVTAGLSVILLIAMISTAATREWTGFFQRAFLVTLYMWMGIFAYRIWREDDQVGA